MSARILAFLPIAETRTVNACDSFVPWQLAKSFWIRNSNKLHGFRSVTDIVAITVNKQVGSGSVYQLKSSTGNHLPVICRHTLTDNSSSYRNKLVVDVINIQFVYFFSDLLYQISSSWSVYVSFEVCRIHVSL